MDGRLDMRLLQGQQIDFWGPYRTIRLRATDQLAVVGGGTITLVADYEAASAEIERREALVERMPAIRAQIAAMRVERKLRQAEAERKAREEREAAEAAAWAEQLQGWPDEEDESTCAICAEGMTVEVDEEFGPMCADCILAAGFEFYDDDNEAETQQEVA